MSQENGSISSFSEDDADDLDLKEEEVPECCQHILSITNDCKHLSYDHYINALDHFRTHNASRSFPTSSIYSNAMLAIFPHFHREFPLSDTLHREWMELRIQSFTIERDGEWTLTWDAFLTIRHLFEGACADYRSVDLALWYLQNSQQIEDCDWKCLEEDLLMVVDTIGLHYSRGDEIWVACREWYMQSEITMESRIAKIDALYRRQLQIPLQQNDLVLSEYRSWYSHNSHVLSNAMQDGDPLEKATSTQRIYSRSFGRKLAHFEQVLTEALQLETEKPGSLEQSWLVYLEFVLSNVIPVINRHQGCEDEKEDLGLKVMQVFYERAIKDICMSSSIWTRYIQFLQKHKNASVCQLQSICERSVWNVYMDSSLWCQCILVYEQGREYDRLDRFLENQLFERQSPQNPVMDEHHAISVLLMYCDTARRRCFDTKNLEGLVRLRNVFNKSIDFFVQSYPDSSVYQFQLQSYRLHCEFLFEEQGSALAPTPHSSNESDWEEGWEKILASRSSQAVVWMQYYRALLIRRRIRYLESDSDRTGLNTTTVVYPSQLGIQAVRKSCFERAIQSVQDTPLVVFEAWHTFEREHGDLPSFLRARNLYTEALEQHTKNAKSPKVATEESLIEISSRKRPRQQITGSSVSRLRSKKSDTGSTKKESCQKECSTAHFDETHTVFVSNIDKEVTEDRLRSAIAESVPSVQAVRLVAKKRAHGLKSRGFAYVSFADEESCQAALKLDGLVVYGKPISIQPYDMSTADASNPSPPKNDEGRAKRTLYIGNLQMILASNTIRGNASALKCVLQDAVSQSIDTSELKDIYVPQEQRGNRHAKKYALVEFTSEDVVDRILSREEQQLFQQKICSCADVNAEEKNFSITLRRSHMSINKIKEQSQQKRKKSKGQSGQKVNASETNIPAQQSNLINLRPRSINRKKKEKLKLQSSTEEMKMEPIASMKSNQDFRELFLNVGK